MGSDSSPHYQSRIILTYSPLSNYVPLPLITLPFSLVHFNENPIYLFLFWELRGLSPLDIHVSVNDLYIPRIGSHIWLQQNRQTDPGNI
jgi:hypothetical protein